MIIVGLSATPARGASVEGEPAGETDFCARLPEQCRASPEASANVAQLATVVGINRQVDTQFVFITDDDQYHQHDFWALLTSNGRGDCEDFALTKRALLIGAGVPAGAIALAIVIDKGDQHAVLLVRFSDRVVVLDNLKSDIGTARELSEIDPIAYTAWGDIRAWSLGRHALRLIAAPQRISSASPT